VHWFYGLEFNPTTLIHQQDVVTGSGPKFLTTGPTVLSARFLLLISA
jgi:hypothetical protein